MHARWFTVLLAGLLLMSLGGCKGRGGIFDRSADWEKAYYRSGQRVVIDRYEIDVRNDRALTKVFTYRDQDAVISAQGAGMLSTLEGVEVFPVRGRIHEAMRGVTTQSTLRRTQQYSFDLSNERWAYTVPLPRGTDGYLTATPPGSSELSTLQDLELVLGPAVGFEEGIELTTLLAACDQAGQKLDQPLARFDLFLANGQSVVIRTAPVAGGRSPLTFDRDGQTYETVFVVSYVKVRQYPPPLRKYLRFW
ncbi:MAG: hypothetical protein AAGC44_14200 [Planctomycetota bacterium]